jgi:acetylornithine deacetylase/succinyl-diaminopimelate desuccinylase-like protein
MSDYITRIAPAGVRVEVSSGWGVAAVVVSRTAPVVAAASRAMEAGFGKPPVFIGTGGSIGPVGSFDRILKLPQVLIGVGLPDDQIHAPNEKFSLSQFFGGILTMTVLYDEIAKG